MTDDAPNPWFPPAYFLEQFQELDEQAAEGQRELMQQFAFANSMTPFNGLTGFPGTEAGVFKARVQSGGRISIPEPERDAHDIEEGDIVQAIIIPIKQDETND